MDVLLKAYILLVISHYLLGLIRVPQGVSGLFNTILLNTIFGTPSITLLYKTLRCTSWTHYSELFRASWAFRHALVAVINIEKQTPVNDLLRHIALIYYKSIVFAIKTSHLRIASGQNAQPLIEANLWLWMTNRRNGKAK